MMLNTNLFVAELTRVRLEAERQVEVRKEIQIIYRTNYIQSLLIL